MEHHTGCVVCGADLNYLTDYREVTCHYCKTTTQSNIACPEGHFVCDTCHARSGTDLIETYCNHSTSLDPFEMATEIMRSEKIRMHGPEHHFLVPALLLSVYCNLTGDPGKADKIAIARRRAEKVPGGFCGSHGTCGAAVGTGIFISLIQGATSLSMGEWRMSNLMTGQTQIMIAEQGGPRCCKRDVYLSLQSAVRFLNEHLDCALPMPKIFCEFSEKNRECIKFKCTFFDSRSIVY